MKRRALRGGVCGLAAALALTACSSSSPGSGSPAVPADFNAPDIFATDIGQAQANRFPKPPPPSRVIRPPWPRWNRLKPDHAER